jgi:hypothetical protein
LFFIGVEQITKLAVFFPLNPLTEVDLQCMIFKIPSKKNFFKQNKLQDNKDESVHSFQNFINSKSGGLFWRTSVTESCFPWIAVKVVVIS